jgi:nitrogen fixation protein
LQNISELCRSNKQDDEEPEMPTHRVDKFGNPITKQRGYRISFRDEVLPAS